MDGVAELASKLNRPPASLAAFSRLTDQQLQILAKAIDATYEARQREINSQLAHGLGGELPAKLLRGRSV
jgi:hypothetical protein